MKEKITYNGELEGVDIKMGHLNFEVRSRQKKIKIQIRRGSYKVRAVDWWTALFCVFSDFPV